MIGGNTQVPAAVMELMEKLKAMTIENGCTPSEAASAASRLQDMLFKYQVSIADVGSRDSFGEPVVQHTKETGYDKRMPSEYMQFAACIAEGFQCKLIRSGSKLHFIGAVSDATVAAFFVDTVYPKVRLAGCAAVRRLGKSGMSVNQYVASFVVGAATEIRRRLLERYAQPDLPESVAALVPIKKQRVDDMVKELFPRLGTFHSRQTFDRDSIMAGQEYGGKVDLVDGIESGSARPTPALGGR